MSDAPLKNCPECNGVVRRLVSGGSGLIFKGSGFYLTDYVKEDKSKKKSEEKPKKNVSKNQDKESAKS
jgi:predicted nucleic acid-binding Zn ribbon protein|tara:strand:- start:2423 stop:2626 length:204 start_codon:yes stop_codon:yes gene_type:complete